MRIFLFLIFSIFSVSAFAQTPESNVSILDTVTKAMTIAASEKIMPQALIWLGSFMGLQFIITNLALLKSGSDIEAIFGKFIGSMMWFGFCVFVLQKGPDFIDSVGNGVFDKFAPNLPTTGFIILTTLSVCTSLLVGIAAIGTSVIGTGNSSLAMVLVYVLFAVFSIGMFMAIKIFMLQLELGLIIMLSPLSFSFLGLNALKDQGIAPFKSLISLVYRIILLGIIFSAFSQVIVVSANQLNAVSWANLTEWPEKFKIIFSMLTAFPLLAYLTYKSDSIASSLAGGSSNMGAGDVAGAAAAGAAAGAAVMSGGGSAVGAASKIPQSMGAFMNMMGGGGSVANASDSGRGQTPDMPPRRPDPLSSTGPSNPSNPSGGSAPGSAPKRPTPSSNSVPSASGGAPVRPGSGTSAGIGNGDASNLTGQQSQNQQSKPSFLNNLKEVNQHISQEKSATHISINTGNSD